MLTESPILLKNVNLLKKYHNSLIFDYTEYPTKGNWKTTFSENDYVAGIADWLHKTPEESALLYVHTPYCEELCYFCLCSKEITRDYEKVKDYLYNYLVPEIRLLKEKFDSIGILPKFKEIYFGGGSPTYYREEDFKYLVEELAGLFDLKMIESWTVEIDPRRVDKERLKFYHSLGVNRLSFGIQDFDPVVQQEINRIQPPSLVAELLDDEIRGLFPAINFDLLIGLPKQTVKGVEETMSRVVELRPTQLQTMYMHYKPDIRKYMTRMVRNGPLPDFYDRKALFLKASETLTSGGYRRAGFESYALPGDELEASIADGKAYYNSLGTQRGAARNFIALGSSAHGVFGNTYVQNFYEMEHYRAKISEGKLPVYRGYTMSDDDIVRRQVINQLRTYFKVFFESYENILGVGFESYFAKELETLKEFENDGLVNISSTAITMTELGQHFSPQICEVFDSYSRRSKYDRTIPLIPV